MKSTLQLDFFFELLKDKRAKGGKQMSGVAVSFVTGSGAIEHNNREHIHKNVDKERMENNINYKDEKIQDAYEKCFGDSVEKYNQKQTRSDRKIDNYFKKIKNSGNNEKLFYENIVQIGDKYTHGFGTGNEQQAIDILDQYAKEFQERNPNLYVFDMKMHLDEATPHLHIDYIPVASGYKTGLETRNSLTKAHQNMGVDKGTGRNDNSTMKWQEREREVIKEIARDHDLELVNKNTDRKHLTVDEYKTYAEQVQKQYDKFVDRNIEMKTGKIPFSDKVVLAKDDFEKLNRTAKYKLVKDEIMTSYTKKLEKKEIELNNLADKLKEKDNVLRIKKDVFKDFVSEKSEEINELNNNYLNLYEKQLNLNEINESLENENKILKTKNLKIQPLEEKVEDLAHVFANQMKAINLLLYDKNDYALKMSDKQKTLIKALGSYTQGWLEQVEKKDLAKEVGSKMGISKGVQENINALNKQKRKSLDIGGR